MSTSDTMPTPPPPLLVFLLAVPAFNHGPVICRKKTVGFGESALALFPIRFGSSRAFTAAHLHANAGTLAALVCFYQTTFNGELFCFCSLLFLFFLHFFSPLLRARKFAVACSRHSSRHVSMFLASFWLPGGSTSRIVLVRSIDHRWRALVLATGWRRVVRTLDARIPRLGFLFEFTFLNCLKVCICRQCEYCSCERRVAN